jgi:hypothetical protein
MFKVNKNVDANGTSFHGVTIRANVQDLIDVLGEPASFVQDRHEKVQIEWLFENEDGDALTLYDCKQGYSIDTTDTLEFHIGAKRIRKELCDDLKDWLKEKLDTLVPQV